MLKNYHFKFKIERMGLIIKQETIRANLLIELDDCLLNIEKKQVVFFPDVEKLLTKIELFSDEIHSYTLTRCTTMLKLRISTYTTSSIPLDADKIIYSELNRVKYFLEHVVPTPKKKTSV